LKEKIEEHNKAALDGTKKVNNLTSEFTFLESACASMSSKIEIQMSL
jgi:hypothetical protein